uniref:Uncharacterized protein n=1 Tax=Noctiluca scintillans TaxID=2966 RepID=A0A7S1FA69_NOCSC
MFSECGDDVTTECGSLSGSVASSCDNLSEKTCASRRSVWQSSSFHKAYTPKGSAELKEPNLISMESVRSLPLVLKTEDSISISAVTALMDHVVWEFRVCSLHKVLLSVRKRNALCAAVRFVERKSSSATVIWEDALAKVVVSEQQVFADVASMLKGEHCTERWAALETLLKLVWKGDVHRINKSIARLQHERDMKVAVVQALTELVERSDDNSDVDHDIWDVRIVALEALAEVAERGCARAVAATVHCLQSDNWVARLTAVEVLGKITEASDLHGVFSVAACMVDDVCDVSLVAVDVFSRLVKSGDQQATALLCARLEDPLPIRKAAIEALVRVAEHGDALSTRCLTNRLKDESRDVRVASLGAVAHIAEQGDQCLIAAVIACLQDESRSVRSAAVDALSMVAERGDRNALEAVGALFVHPDSLVRETAMLALGRIAKRGDLRIISQTKTPR